MRIRRALALGAIPLVLFSTAGIAHADNVVNDVTSTDDSRTITAGGSTTVSYWIVATNGDSQSGCNASVASPATVTINPPAGVSADDTSLTFTTCGAANDQSVTFSSATPGDYLIGVSVSDSGVGTYNTNPAAFTLHVNAAPPPSDSTPPVITYDVNPDAPDGLNGWYKSDVTLTWTVTENESPGSLVKTGCDDQNVTADQQATTYSCSASSAGGSAGPVEVTIKRDGTAPDVSLVGGPADGASYYFGDVPAAPTCDASDATSLLSSDGCQVGGYATTVGSHTVTASASDNAGNGASDSAGYTVLAWDLKGFYAPVDMGGILNTVKGGSTVPLKFEIFKGATELTSTSAVNTFVQTRVTCTALDGQGTDEVEVVTTGGTSLRYDTTGGQFIQNWQTPKLAGACYRVTLTADDGSAAVAYFKLR